MDQNPTLVKRKNVHWKEVDGEAVLLHFGSGNYYALDAVGTFLWSRIQQGPLRMNELVDSLAKEYTISESTAGNDVRDFCHQLEAENLLELRV
ncbi:MAG: PqqD family protein [Bdellovibrionales bacterium]|nr:PqqD family protein [Bdellovibrionales bacterium]